MRAVDLPAKPLPSANLGAPSVVPKSAEQVWVAVPEGESATGSVASLGAVQPTQVRRPWRSTVRTVFQAAVGLCAMAPVVYEAATNHDPTLAGGAAGAGLAISAGVTRVMALPVVETWLRRYVRFLAAAPR